jgi:replicative DNA helicase
VPQLSDLRESGSIEADADVVMFLYRDEVYHPDSGRPNTADIIVAKHRNGPVGEVCVAFEKAHTRFRDMVVSVPMASREASEEQSDEEDEDIDV